MASRRSKLDLGRRGEAAFERLSAAVQLCPRLGIALVISEYSEARAEVLARLTQNAPALERHPPVLTALRAGFALAKVPPGAGGAAVLWVEADAQLDAPGVAALREWLAAANRERENLHAAGHLFLIIAGAPPLRALVREAAPDLWALSPPVLVFDEQPRPLQTREPTATEPSRIDWLHLSDLHLGRAADWREDTVLAHLERDLPQLLADGDLAPRLVFVTGDLAWSGKAEQYDLVHTFLAKLLDGLGLSPGESLFLVPGNHDVDRASIGPSARSVQAHLLGLGGAGREEFRATTGEILGSPREFEGFGRRLSSYCAFTTRLLGPARGVSSDRPFRTDVRELGGIAVGVASLNSAWLCGPDEDKKGRIVLGERQVRDALNELGSAGATLRVVLLHHPLEWLHEAEDRAVRELLTAEADVVLHGHLHETDLFASLSPSGTSVVSAAGAAYAGSGYPHGFQAARFDPVSGELALHFFKYVTRGGGYWSVDHDLGSNAKDGRMVLKLRPLVARPPVAGDATRMTRPLGARLKQAVLQVYGRVDFVGLADNAPKPKAKLDDLYVPATFEVAQERAIPQGEQTSNPNAKQRSLVELEQSLLGAADEGDAAGYRAVVLGDPGSGKSTLLLHLALTAAAHPTGPIPVVVKLREYIRQGRHDGLLAFAASECTQLLQVPTDEAQLATAAAEGQLLLLVDGLDEVVDEDDRVRIRDQLVALVERFPRTRLVATSRSVGYDRAPLPDERFATLRLLSFDDDEIQAFIQRWYRVAIPDDPRERERQTANLWDALGREPRARALARVPVLATLIALVHRFETNLPGERAALYDLCVKTLVITWPRARGRRFAGLDEVLQRAVLEALALRLQEHREGHVANITIGRRELIQLLCELFAERGHGTSAGERRDLAERWVQWLQADTGVLVEQQPGVFGFLHLSLMEFLAARALLEREGSRGDRALAAFITNHHRLPSWQETCLLALGSESTRRGLVDATVTALLKSARRASDDSDIGESWKSWVFLLALLREEVDVRLEARDAILEGAAQGAVQRRPNEGAVATRWLSDVVRFGRRHGTAIRDRLTWQLAHAAGDLLVGTVALAPEELEYVAVLDKRPDRSQLVLSLLDFGRDHRAGAWARSTATANDLFAWLDQSPVDIAALRTLEGLAEPQLGAAYSVLIARTLEWRSLIAERAAERALPAAVRWEVPTRGLAVDVWLCPGIVLSARSAKPFGQLLARPFARDFAGEVASNLAQNVASGFVFAFSSDFARDVAKGFAGDFVPFKPRLVRDFVFTFGRTFAASFAHDFPLSFVFQFIHDVAHEVRLTALPTPENRVPALANEWTRNESPSATGVQTEQHVSLRYLSITAEAWAGLLLSATADLESPLAAALISSRVQDAWLWLYFDPLAQHVRNRQDGDEPTRVGLLLALGLRQMQTTGVWPWGPQWAKLTAEPAPEHWFAAYWWHAVRAVTEQDPSRAALEYAAAEAALDRSDWPELAQELRRCRIIRTPPELAARFGDTLPQATE